LEKKNRLINFLNGAAETEGLEEIFVDSLTVFSQDKRILMSLIGSATLTSANNLVAFCRKFSAHYKNELDPGFVDVDEGNVADRLPALEGLIKYRIERTDRTLSSFASSIRLTWSEGGVKAMVSSGMYTVFDDARFEAMEKIISDCFCSVTGVKPGFVKIEQALVADSDELFSNTFEDAYRYEVINIEQEAVSKEKLQNNKDMSAVSSNPESWAERAKVAQAKKPKKQMKDFIPQKNSDATLIGRVKAGMKTLDIVNLEIGDRDVNIVGDILIDVKEDMRLLGSGKFVLAKFTVLDKTGGMSCVMFIKPDQADAFQDMFAKGGFAGFQGNVENDTYSGQPQLKVNGIFEASRPAGRVDTARETRVELHCHTTFSEKDATSVPSKLMKLAASFGHRACAVTDHGVVQAFPDVCKTMNEINKNNPDAEEPFKAILGCEGYLVDDGPTVFFNLPYNREDIRKAGEFVTVSIETTGPDACRDLIKSVRASKYRIKGYVPAPPYTEGEPDEAAIEYASKDIDRSLWDASEYPDTLKDDAIAITSDVEYKKIGKVENMSLPLDVECGGEFIPEEVVFEHVADFYAEFEDGIYKDGEPFDSYFAMGNLLDFIGQAYLVGSDIFNTLAFLRRAGFGIDIEAHKYYNYKFNMPCVNIEDVLRYWFPDGNPFEGEDTLTMCADLFKSMVEKAGTADPYEINASIGHKSEEDIKKRKVSPTYHIIYLARSKVGLYSLYNLVSESHVHWFSMRPRTPKSLLRYWRSGLVIGGACERGEIYRHVMKAYKECGKNRDTARSVLKDSAEFADILSLYDYIEIQPLCNNMFMTRQDPEKSDTGNVPVTKEDIRIVNELLVETADDHNMPCCATTDSHYLEKDEGQYRKYIMMDMGFKDAEMQSDLYFRTTDEMLEEFSYLGDAKAKEVVVTNTNKIADLIEFGLKPFPEGTYPPLISHAPTDVRDITYTRANRMYRYKGELNPVVKSRVEKELNSIIGNGFAIMYYIAYRLVKKSNDDGYIVGSRGSVGSSFVATMMGISEVNPLPPHYRCPHCNYTEFDNSGNYGSGYDLPPKNCPECNIPMEKDGQDIPFETFLGFHGDKQPDIDLNFSGEYQPHAHKYVEYLFGTTHTFRAGTITAYKAKNATALVKKICDNREEPYTDAKLKFMANGIIGVKSTTGQHPGGIVVLPKEMDIYEFCPVQYPANKTDAEMVTTHFDFNSLHDTILKLDILGHDDPTTLRMLSDMTGVDVNTIPIPDDGVMSLLESTDALKFTPEGKIYDHDGTVGIPELGTNMARGMIKEAKPSHFYDLVQLMGLSHGTDVWAGNAQELIRNGTCDLNSVIGCRDSIMTRLIYWGLPNKDSFDIMEKVRKGKGLTPEHEALMRENHVPDWYIDSCKKIKYMFPKAHAAAYSISSLRVAWFKVYYPAEYYCAFYTVRGDEFDAETMCFGRARVTAHKEVVAEQMRVDPNPKVKSEFYLCELVEEMYDRGIEFAPVDLELSDGVKFQKVSDTLIRPPFSAIDGISEAMGKAIVAAREESPFKNREEFTNRTGIGQSATQKLVDYGKILDDLPESAQITLFDLLGDNT